jgi:hypothetical protein
MNSSRRMLTEGQIDVLRELLEQNKEFHRSVHFLWNDLIAEMIRLHQQSWNRLFKGLLRVSAKVPEGCMWQRNDARSSNSS